MNYQKLIKDLQAEVKGAVRFKQIGTAYRVLTLIGLLPVLLFKWLLVIEFYVYLFLYNALLSPVSYLESWQNERSKNVKHATEAVIFLVSTPFIFFLRMLMSIASFIFYFLWFFLMCANYVLTLGSIRWQPFLNTATFDPEKEYRWKLRPAETGTMVFGIIIFALYCITVLLNFLYDPIGVRELYEVSEVFTTIYYIVALIVNPILFRKRELAEGEEEYTAPRQTNSFVNASQTYNQQPYGQTYNNQQSYGQAYNQQPYGQTYNNQQSYGQTYNNQQSYGQTYNQQPYGQTYNPTAQQPEQPAPEAAQDTDNV